MNDPAVVAKVVVSCPECDFRREYDTHSRRVSGAVSGHLRDFSCPGEPTVTETLVCDSCGYAHGEDGTEVAAVARAEPYAERTLCGVCRDFRDEMRAQKALEWVLET